MSRMPLMRRRLGEGRRHADMPNLIDVQRESYASFLQRDVKETERQDKGLQGALQSVFPIRDYTGRAELRFLNYELEEEKPPKNDFRECQKRGLTYAWKLKLTLELCIWDLDEENEMRTFRESKRQSVYMGEVPKMTNDGTFVIKGTTRVVVSQMHRSPGVFFDNDKGKNTSGKVIHSARVIPYRGSWIDFEFDGKDLMYVRIDRKRKMLLTTFLMALPLDDYEAKPLRRRAKKGEDELAAGMSRKDILDYFYDTQTWKRKKDGWVVPFIPELWEGQTFPYELHDADKNKQLCEANKRLTKRQAASFVKEGVKNLYIPDEALLGHFLAQDIAFVPQNETQKAPQGDDKGTDKDSDKDSDKNRGKGDVKNDKNDKKAAADEVKQPTAGDEITEEVLELIKKHAPKQLDVLVIHNAKGGAYIRRTLAADKNKARGESLIDIYHVMRPGEPPTNESADLLLRQMFFDFERYDLSSVGRVKMNARLNLDCPVETRVLRREDIFAVIETLIAVKDEKDSVDDIDHLSNRRVRSVGELMENQYRVGLLRMERSIRERMSSAEIHKMMPNDLINAKPVVAAMREFFGSSQLSQFMDQTNPLAEVTHKRRLSALGSGGLTRERAGFEVRDVHTSHYGRICPIETPEGPNIGLINSLATYARVNEYGFIETPYYKVQGGVISHKVDYLSAVEEDRYAIAQANEEVDEKGRLVNELITCRKGGGFELRSPSDVDYIDVSPKQLVSVAAALIPFLENDDANRALMGSNMQRQAVPLIRSESPIVGTGMEAVVARDSGATVITRRAGIVDQVDASRIVIHASDSESKKGGAVGVDIYNLQKFERSNQSTCVNQKPLVLRGDVVKAGEIIADGSATDKGELALGRNVLVAFMPWNGYNFEDSILISERLVRDDVFTSVHIEEFEVKARDTKLGHEEITRDLPNVSEEAFRKLDEVGIVHVGAYVHPGDILVGKVTPKGESPITPEEKLLRAIFGEKASDVRDTSLRVPSGSEGTVIDVRVLTRQGVDKDERVQLSEGEEIERFKKDHEDQKAIYERDFNRRLRDILAGEKLVADAEDLKKGTVLTKEMLANLKSGTVRRIAVKNNEVMDAVEKMRKSLNEHVSRLESDLEAAIKDRREGDELEPSVLKVVKVFIAAKRKIQSGDKMAGRHGNKGVVSKIVPIEDMPHTKEGVPVDVVLNPLGVPSRMNVGQILETHLGWAAAGLGRKIGDMAAALTRKETAEQDLDDWMTKVYEDDISLSSLKKMNAKLRLSHGMELKERGVRIATPVFEGARESDINAWLTEAGLNESGQEILIDGLTGEEFARPVTMGYLYMLKLNHLVDDKIHARSTGPYSLLTQQPLGGKAQMGGQRFGEMEVWALEAYGAAYTLQEMLTIKSDDVAGRTRTYESIVKGEESFEAGVPESFNVLVMELKSLGLSVELREDIQKKELAQAAIDNRERNRERMIS